MNGRQEKPKLIGSNVHYFYYNTSYFLESMAEAGYTEIELYLGTPHIFVDGHGIYDFSHVKQLADSRGIRIQSVHPETISLRYSLCQPDEEWLARNVAAYQHSIDFAVSVGADSVNTNLTGAGRDRNFELNWEQMKKAVAQVADYAAERGIALILETESPQFEGFVTNIGLLKRLTDEIGSDCLGAGINVRAMKAAGETFADWKACFGEKCSYIRIGSREEKKEMTNLLNDEQAVEHMIYYPLDDKCLDDPRSFDMAFTGKGACLA